MFKKHPLSSAIALSAGLVSGLMALPAQSQMLEEVVVTATKRAVGMQDVPIALSVMEGEKIAEQGIGSLTDLAVFMPNVHVAEASAGDQLFIRGIGSGVNYGFEQSVGTFIDGVYFGRGQASRSAFLDLSRVEVLKGSQSTLFGKNTIAGAINITTAKPGDEFEGSIEYSNEPEFDGQGATLTLSGPITDTFGARFVVTADETEGWMDNTFLDTNETRKDNLVYRITLGWEPTDDLQVYFKYEGGESDATGSNETISVVTPLAASIYQTVDPNVPFGLGYAKSDATFQSPERRGESYHDSQWEVYTLNAELAVGEYTVKSITGFVDYQFDNYRDSDYSALAAIARGRDETHEQFTQEFILQSPLGETFEWMAGLYYQEEELSHDRFTDVSLSNLFNAGAALPPITATGIADATGLSYFSQDAETFSGFFEGTFNVGDSWRVVAGIRYSEDTKEFDKGGFVAPLLTTGPESDLLAAVYDGSLNLATKHSFADGVAERCPADPVPVGVTSTTVTCVTSAINTEREEDHITGDITLQWDMNDDTMVYLKWGNGYKAGGFDEDNGRGYIDAEEYEDEESETWELGAKLDLLEGRGRLNIAAFSSTYDNVQVSTFDGNAGFVVGNAAETEVQGIELDGMLAITDELTVAAGLAYLDATYKSFTDAGCTDAQTSVFTAGADGILVTADDQLGANCTQDLSGQPLQFAPETSGNIALIYETELVDGFGFKGTIDMMYTDDYETGADLDPVLTQDSFTKFNARLELSGGEGQWSLALLGRNLTDETTSTWGNDVPLGAFGFSGTYFQIVDAPRSFEFQARYNF
ncbi:MAG: iron complex outermembrane receptor protein [Planctomycetaceae bacterium]|jgi:iron complex outermembrane receptor protein